MMRCRGDPDRESSCVSSGKRTISGSRPSQLNPVQAELDAFGLQQDGMLPGFAGLYMGFLTPFWLIIFLAGTGLAAGRGERWLLRRQTVPRLVLLAGAVIAVLSYEQGLPGMLVAFRPAVFVAVAARLAEIVVARRRRRHGGLPAWLQSEARSRA